MNTTTNNRLPVLLSALLLPMLPMLALAQSSDQNYIKTQTMLDANGTRSVQAVQYFNGLGYPTVSVSSVGGNGETVYSMVTYDSAGREERKYLPYSADKALLYKAPNTIMLESANANSGDDLAFSQNHYDALDRIFSVDLPGKDWQGHGNNTEFSFNTTDEVLLYKAHAGVNSLVAPSGSSMYYPAGTLTKVTTVDADQKKVITFKNLLDKVVLQRTVLDESTFLDTYYVYDDLGLLRFVLTPNYKNFSDKAINAYEYRYNNRGLVKEKILPGCGSVLYWYDNADRLVCMQDSVMRASGKYRFCLYDNLGRLAIQGLCTKCSRDESLVFTAEFTKGASGLLGTGYVLPSKCINELVNPVLEVVNYYDDHDFMSNSYFNNMSLTETCCQTGQLTGTVSRATNGEYISQAMMYDLKGNLTKCVSREIGGRIVTNDNSYSFTNNVVSSVYDIDVLYGSHLSLSENYEYNRYNDKKSKATLTVGHSGSAVSSSLSYAYDGLGRLSNVTRPLSAVSNKDVSYTYDLHGWMKSITANGFTENLHYADGNGTPCYNGNISSIDWQSYPTSQKRAYRYTYDNANRLTLAEYYDGDNKTDHYTEKAEYDSNGNATRIIRHGMTSKGFGIMDNLTVSYHGNQLSSVSEAADDYNAAGSFEYKKANGSGYIYNGNGSLVADKSRGIVYISYDFNNNPEMVYFTNGGITKYVYSSAGQKLRVVHYTAVPNVSRTWGEKPVMLTAAQILSADSTDYLLGGRLVMQNGRVDKVIFDGGYAQATKSTTTTTADTFAFYYFNQDHLGNNCEVLNAKGTLSQATNYYPFGAPYSDASSQFSPSLQPYKFGGKELDLMHGLNTFDFGARQHDPILIRWDRMDPLSEKYYYTSPFAYCGGTPVNAFDPDGRLIIFINGNHFGDGGTSVYWGGIDNQIMNTTLDFHAFYYDGAMGGNLNLASMSCSNRMQSGYKKGYSEASRIISAANDESLKFVTHSMGGAYGNGFVKGLQQWAHDNNKVLPPIDYILDIAPFQGSSIEVSPDMQSKTIELSHTDDYIAGGKEKGILNFHLSSSGNWLNPKNFFGHGVGTFKTDIMQWLPESSIPSFDNSRWEENKTPK